MEVKERVIEWSARSVLESDKCLILGSFPSISIAMIQTLKIDGKNP